MNNTASPEEIQVLTAWIKRNPEAYKDYVELHYLITRDKNNGEAEHFKKDLLFKFNSMFKKQKRAQVWLKYAAILIVALAGTSYLFLKQSGTAVKVQQEVTITFGNGKQDILNTKAFHVISNANAVVAKQEGTKLIYNVDEVNTIDEHQPLVYNTVHVPYGKTFQVVLSDGTEVHLNSGTTFTYPTAFYTTGERHVELIGEAYFSVTSDSLRPFMVQSKLLETRVLGTEFNFSSYPDDDVAHVVLVEGRVAVSQQENLASAEVFLKPNQMATYSPNQDDIEVTDVDVSRYTAWISGILYFRNETFSHIAKKLERHYSVKIDIENDSLKSEKFTGRFKTESIEEVLQGFQRLKTFEYVLKDDHIILTHNTKKPMP
ncbi:FecR family protein [Formosa algae]|uniref:Ferric-dicitrate binding protein FerR (Iron transport regulator) n=1 Tax=Formosa algae TaxID=225843 RepID=A0A9X1CDW3_9FLAO|nr:FecR domain-containing protein [Formosa algae]MBP1841654.1 ferric-dicitrate binding protein FerR (iron transport regulator) [Formosa algae]MDQ0337145.1 ferric-dicitrate binding protein FerR (iron transport regulator) [Formosa algae]